MSSNTSTFTISPPPKASGGQQKGSGAPRDPREALRLAAIDVGSNSIHMIVAQADADGGLTTLWRLKEQVGLGRMSFPSRRLSKQAMDRAIATLARFKQAAQQRHCEKIVAIATSAVREATNGGDLIERAKRELGLRIRVVSGRDEARLIYQGVRHAIDFAGQMHLIVDIGGGSVEFIVGDERKAMLLETRKLGAARLSARYVHTDPISKSDREALIRHFDRELPRLCESIAALKPAVVIGTSGTLENLAAMCGSTSAPAAQTGDDKSVGIAAAPIAVLKREPLEKLVEKLMNSTGAERVQIKGLDDQRSDQILAGAMLVGELFRRLNIEQIAISPAAMREGVLIDYLSRHIPDLRIRRDVPDPRRRSVLDLARRCDWHQSHSEHVARICLKLFDDLRPLHKLGPDARELIEYAALLHDIGWHISNKGHHKHSMYLIANGDLKGFGDEQIQVIANIARYHRKSEPKKSHPQYEALSHAARRIVDIGVALLRLADGLDRSHSSVVSHLRCRFGDHHHHGATDDVRCTIDADGDAELELWGAERKKKWFGKMFGRDIRFALARR